MVAGEKRRNLCAVVVVIGSLFAGTARAAGPEIVPAASPQAATWKPVSALLPSEIEQGTEGRIGLALAVVDPTGECYELNGDQAFHSASVVKVAIMLAFLDRLAAEERDPTGEDQQLLEAMITLSDNDAATALWNAVGAGAGMTAYMEGVGIPGFVPDPEERWG